MIGIPWDFSALHVGDDPQDVRHEDGLCALLDERGNLLRVDGGRVGLHVRHEGHEPPVLEDAQPERRREGRKDDRIGRRETERLEGDAHGEVVVGKGDAPRVPEEVAHARNELPRNLARADLVGDDTGEDAPHVLAFHRGSKNRYCHSSAIGVRRARFVNGPRAPPGHSRESGVMRGGARDDASSWTGIAIYFHGHARLGYLFSVIGCNS